MDRRHYPFNQAITNRLGSNNRLTRQQPASQQINQSTNQPISQSANQWPPSLSRSINQSTRRNQSIPLDVFRRDASNCIPVEGFTRSFGCYCISFDKSSRTKNFCQNREMSLPSWPAIQEDPIHRDPIQRGPLQALLEYRTVGKTG